MKNIIATTLFSLCLIGCASYSGIISPSMTNNQVKNFLKDENITQAEPNMLLTETPIPSPEITGKTNEQEASLLLLGSEIFAFSENEPGWYTVDDNVMGGVSNSTVKVNDSGILSFSGTMSLENNGGFSSVRSEWTPTNLYGTDGLLLRVLGDGKIYRLRIHSATTGGDIAYNAIFETNPDTWNIVYIPFASMVPTYRGFLMDVGKLDTASIGSFGFMLSDKQPGEFELQVDWMRAIAEDELPLTGLN